MTKTSKELMRIMRSDEVSCHDVETYIGRMISNLNYAKNNGTDLNFNNLEGNLKLVKDSLNRIDSK